MKRKIYPYKPDYAVKPGEAIREQLDLMNMTQKELAKRMRRPIEQVNRLIHGHIGLTPETALQLEHVLGLPAMFWASLESGYRIHLARKKAKP